MTLRESIMAAVVTTLAGITLDTESVSIVRSRNANYTIADLPLIGVFQRTENVDYEVYNKAERDLNVDLEILICDSDGYETDLNDIYGQAAQKLLANPTLGITGVYDIIETQITEPTIVNDADYNIYRMVSSYMVKYRTAHDNPEVS